MELRHLRTHALIIGGGLAGLSAALELRSEGKDVIVVSKGKIGRSGNTIMAKNSMAAVLPGRSETGTILEHVEDTLSGGSYLNDSALVEVLARRAVDGIRRLITWGVPFIRERGEIVVKGSPGHRMKRLLSVDASRVKSTHTEGLALSEPIRQRLEKSGAILLDWILITCLLKKDGQVCGAYGLAKDRPEVWVIEAKAVILANGGAGQVYPLTTNAGDVTGDGYALGYQAGAKVRDLEFIQFHPTVTMGQGKEVLSTAPFGDGAVLRNNLGEAFMSRYSSQADMATRDVMARAIDSELKAGRGTERGGVFVDFSSVPEKKMLREYAPIHNRLKGKTNIEVGTAAHFMMGGIIIDRGGYTGIPGLYACGEVAGGVHGANRLAGNALTEAVVFGIEAARQAANDATPTVKHLESQELEKILAESGIRLGEDIPWKKAEPPEAAETVGIEEVAGAVETASVKQSDLAETLSRSDLEGFKRTLRTVMGVHVGLVRSEKGLLEAKERIGEINAKLLAYTPDNYKDLIAWQELKLTVQTAGLISEAAWKRKGSIGAHYRTSASTGNLEHVGEMMNRFVSP
ncbi:L-aspartate oxidase [Peptococcaceae bacterium CEB3]|nr:L-aspartate oxidase [Peptococcaceae bacterium CEB3]